MAIEKGWADDSSQRNLDARSVKLTTALSDVADLVPGAELKGRGRMQGADVVAGDLAGEICAWANDNMAYDKGLVIKTSGYEDHVRKVLAPLTNSMETFPKGFNILLDATRDAMAERVGLAAEERADQWLSATSTGR